jgi:hypothetical protein
MAKKTTIDLIIKAFRELGGNVSDVLGTRTNISFLGVGDNVEPFLDQRLNIDALGVLSQSKAIDEAKNAVGFAVGDKLNDIQANNLLTNLNKMKEFYMPAPVTNITDLATGTRNLDAKGLGALRSKADEAEFFKDVDEAGGMEAFLDKNPIGGPTRKINLPEGVDPRDTILPSRMIDDLPPPGSRGGADDIAAPFVSADETIRNLEKQDPELAVQLKNILSNRGDIPARRSSARNFLVETLKVGDDYPSTTLNDVISAEDAKYIFEGGGGIAGDPIVLVEKYFGPRISEAIPVNASNEEIAIFTKRVLTSVEDAKGLRPDEPGFDRLTASFVEEMADGGRAGFKYGGGADAAYMQIEPKFLTMKGISEDPSLKVGGFGWNKHDTFYDNIGKYLNKYYYLEKLQEKLNKSDFFNKPISEIFSKKADGGRAGFKFGGAGKAFGLAKKLANINKSVDEGTQMGYGALREYGIEAEDITRLFKEIAMDRTMVGPEKTEYFKMLNQVLKNPDQFPDGIIEIKKRLGMDFARGGLAKILEV